MDKVLTSAQIIRFVCENPTKTLNDFRVFWASAHTGDPGKLSASLRARFRNTQGDWRVIHNLPPRLPGGPKAQPAVGPSEHPWLDDESILSMPMPEGLPSSTAMAYAAAIRHPEAPLKAMTTGGFTGSQASFLLQVLRACGPEWWRRVEAAPRSSQREAAPRSHGAAPSALLVPIPGHPTVDYIVRAVCANPAMSLNAFRHALDKAGVEWAPPPYHWYRVVVGWRMLHGLGPMTPASDCDAEPANTTTIPLPGNWSPLDLRPHPEAPMPHRSQRGSIRFALMALLSNPRLGRAEYTGDGVRSQSSGDINDFIAARELLKRVGPPWWRAEFSAFQAAQQAPSRPPGVASPPSEAAERPSVAEEPSNGTPPQPPGAAQRPTAPKGPEAAQGPGDVEQAYKVLAIARDRIMEVCQTLDLIGVEIDCDGNVVLKRARRIEPPKPSWLSVEEV